MISSGSGPSGLLAERLGERAAEGQARRPTDPEELEGLLDADAYKSSVSDREQ